MTKLPRDTVVPEMRERLLTNRTGKLTPAQWVDVVMQPVITLLVLMIPATVVLWTRLALLLRPGLLVLGIITAVLLVTLVARAVRYARTPVHYTTLEAKAGSAPFWMFWKPVRLYDETGNALIFRKRLSPRPIITPGRRYQVYYLKEAGENILLSLGPTDHPDAAQWEPDRFFQTRHKRRTQQE
ncbi:MAG: hypothetical protein SF029_17760 [bacterium]|nr:hypothetical protein [bacterium]